MTKYKEEFIMIKIIRNTFAIFILTAIAAGFVFAPAVAFANNPNNTFAVTLVSDNTRGNLVLLDDYGDINNIPEGSDLMFQASTNLGQRVREWRVDGNIVPSNRALHLTLENWEDDVEVEVIFEDVPSVFHDFSINGTPSGIGSYTAVIEGVTDNALVGATVPGGSFIRLNASAQHNPGYRFVEWQIDMDSTIQTFATNPLTFGPITDDISVTMVFELDTYPVIFTAGANGSITAAANGTPINSGDHVLHGSEVRFTAAPSSAEYRVASWRTNGDLLPYTTNQITGPVLAPLTMHVEFTNMIAINFSQPANGSLRAFLLANVNDTAGSEIQSGARVPAGSLVRFSATANSGFAVGQWTFNNTPTTQGNASVTQNINAALPEITMSVSIVPLATQNRTITLGVFENQTTRGTIVARVNNQELTAGTHNVALNSDVRFEARPAEGFRVAAWRVNNVVVAGNTTNTLDRRIDDNTAVLVEFEPIPTTPQTRRIDFRVRDGDSARGNIAATVNGAAITSGAQVAVGAQVVFTAAPIGNSNRVSQWLVNVVAPQQPNPLTTFTHTVTTDATIVAAFEAIGTNYQVFVNGSNVTNSGAGTHNVGSQVTVSAGTSSNQVFSHWTITGLSGVSTSNPVITFNMPANNVTFTAHWNNIGDLGRDEYLVTVRDSWSSNSGAGVRRADSTVNIQAGTRPGHTFWGWMTFDVDVSNTFSPNTSFVMPHRNVLIEALWLPDDIPWDWMPDWDWNWGWGSGNNQQQFRPPGGVSFGYADGNFPTSSIVVPGGAAHFSIRVDRITNRAGATFVGQWLRDGQNHGGTFNLGLGTATSPGGTTANLNFGAFNATTHSGSYTLQVTTFVGGTAVHVDVSRIMVLTTQTPPATITSATPPALIPQTAQTPRPATPPPAPNRPGVPALPDFNHNEILRLMGESAANTPIVLPLYDGVNTVRLHGRTLDLLIASGRPLFVANGPMWAAMPVPFLTDLRQQGGNLIGQNGGTFDITIDISRDGVNINGGNINFATNINGNIRNITNFSTHYTVVIELGSFGTSNTLAAMQNGRNMGATTNRNTGAMTFNTQTSGNFAIAFVAN